MKKDIALFGRDAESKQLSKLLVEKPIVVVTGMPGVGKTKLVWDFLQNSTSFKNKFWFSGESLERITQKYIEFIAQQGLWLPVTEINIEDLVHLFSNALENCPNYILVYDGVSSIEKISCVLPPFKDTIEQGRIVITSCLAPSYWPKQFSPFVIDALSPSASQALMYSIIAESTSSAIIDSNIPRLANILGNLPLGLIQAAQSMRKFKKSASDCIAVLTTNQDTTWYQDISSNQTFAILAPISARFGQALTTIIEEEKSLKFMRLSCLTVLQFCTYLSPDYIEFHLLKNWMQSKNLTLEPERIEEAIDRLAKHSLIRWLPDKKAIQINCLVQRAIRSHWSLLEHEQELTLINRFLLRNNVIQRLFLIKSATKLFYLLSLSILQYENEIDICLDPQIIFLSRTLINGLEDGYAAITKHEQYISACCQEYKVSQETVKETKSESKQPLTNKDEKTWKLSEENNSLLETMFWTQGWLEKNSGIIGRDQLITQLVSQLDNKPQDKMMIISGMPGIGKSKLAWQCADQTQSYQYKFRFSAVSWLSLLQQYIMFLRAAKFPSNYQLNLFSTNIIIEQFTQCIRRLPGCLLIYDNVSSWEEIAVCIPARLETGNIVVTTRLNLDACVSRSKSIVIRELSLTDSKKLLLRNIEGDQNDAIEQLTAKLGCVPAALIQVSHYARATSIPIKECLEYLEKDKGRLLADSSFTIGYSIKNPMLLVINAELDRVIGEEQTQQGARKLFLQFCSYLSSNRISIVWIKKWFQVLYSQTDNNTATQMLDRLSKRSLIHIENQQIQINPLVQQIIRWRIADTVHFEQLQYIMQVTKVITPAMRVLAIDEILPSELSLLIIEYDSGVLLKLAMIVALRELLQILSEDEATFNIHLQYIYLYYEKYNDTAKKPKTRKSENKSTSKEDNMSNFRLFNQVSKKQKKIQSLEGEKSSSRFECAVM